MRSVDLVVIGGGPAGLTAGLYAQRTGRTVLLLEAVTPGGQAASTWQVDNYPGLPHVNGAELMMKMEQQVRELGLEILSAPVEKIMPGPPHRLHTPAGEIEARAVIIATGAKPKVLGVPGEEKYRGRGVSYCATCDGAFFRDLPVAVIGGGNTALEEAEFLTRFASKVYLIHRREKFRADQVLQNHILHLPKIEVITPFTVGEILGDEQGVNSVMLGPVNARECRQLSVRGVFIFTGLTPQTAIFQDCLTLDQDGCIPTDAYFRTSVPGIFVAGDCRSNPVKQIIVAAGEGAAAAVIADRYLQEQH